MNRQTLWVIVTYGPHMSTCIDAVGKNHVTIYFPGLRQNSSARWRYCVTVTISKMLQNKKLMIRNKIIFYHNAWTFWNLNHIYIHLQAYIIISMTMSRIYFLENWPIEHWHLAVRLLKKDPSSPALHSCVTGWQDFEEDISFLSELSYS